MGECDGAYQLRSESEADFRGERPCGGAQLSDKRGARTRVGAAVSDGASGVNG